MRYWTPSTAYVAGDKVIPTRYQGNYYECYAPGTSGTTEPTWNLTNGGSTSDNSVGWRTRKHANLGTVRIYHGSCNVVIAYNCRVDGTVGKPGQQIIQTSSGNPRHYDRRSQSVTFDISGVLFGPYATVDAKALFDKSKTKMSTDSLAVTLTGVHAEMYGASHHMVFDGSMGLKTSHRLGTRSIIDVMIRLREVYN